jgi:hypothetical protein
MARTDRTRRTDTDPIETSLNRKAHVARVQGLRMSNAAGSHADKRRPKGGRQGVKVETRRAVMV